MTDRSRLKNVVLTAALALGTTAILAAQAVSIKNPASLKETAPATFKAKFDTSAGVFVIDVTRAWAPLGADRFYNLVKNGYFTDVRFFRVVPGFMVQFGIHGDPAVSRVWQPARLQDDPVKESNNRGYVTFAHAGPNTRTTQIFINFGNNAGLDRQGFPPFGRVTTGMEVVDKIYSGDGERPDQGRIQSAGNPYLATAHPKLDYIKTATIEGAAPAAAAPAAAPKK